MFLFLFFKSKFKLLFLFSTLLACVYFASATETVTFHFYYESGINDVSYIYNNFYDGSNMHTPQVSKSNGQTSVSVTAKMDDEKSIANSFISNLTPSPNIHMVGLNTTDSEPDKLDFWIAGALSINGEAVSQEFYIARIPNHYWLGTLDGQTYTGNDGANSPTNRGMQVYGSTTKQPYCLKEHGNEYYAVSVYTGYCSDTDQTQYDWSNAKSTYLQLEYGAPSSSSYGATPVKSLQFNYNQIYNDDHNGYDYLESVQSSYYSDNFTVTQGLKIVVTSKLNADNEPLSSFQSMFNTTTEMLEANSVKVHMPNNLYFWVQGTLVIDGTDEVDDFTIARSHVGWEDRWWIASKNGISKKYQTKNRYSGAITISAMTLNGHCFAIHDASTTTFSTEDDYTFSVFEQDCDSIFN